MAGIMVTTYKRINASRDRQLLSKEYNGYSVEELSDLGDKAMTFR